MNKAIIYLRTSTEEQNPENQLKDCKTLFIDAEVIEEKQSAWSDKKERILFEAIKKRISKGEISDLIVWDWDRLFRNRKKLKEFFQFCAMYKCKIHSFRQKFYEELYKVPAPFNEIMQEMILNLLGWMAEDESTKKSERVKSAVRRKEGEDTKSYKGNKWGRKAIKLDKEIIELHNQGLSIRAITKQIFYYNKNNHKKFVSNGYVHKTISILGKEKSKQLNSHELVN